MSRPRRIAVLLMSLAVVVSVVYGTGAFDSLTAQRDANVQVTGDANGYLALQPSNSSNGAYATYRNGQLRVSLDGALDESASGSGVNPDAVTTVRDIFTITNRGAQPVAVWLTDESDVVRFESGERSVEGPDGAVRLKPGESIPVGVSVDTRQATDETLLSSVTIHADSDGAGGGSGTDQGEDDIVPSLLNPDGSDSDTETTSSDETSLSGSLFPGGDGVQLLSDGSNDDSSTPTPRSAPTPSDGSSESSPSDGEGVPCSAPQGPNSPPERCDPTPGENTTLDTDHPAVLVAGGVVIATPADEAAVAGIVALGGLAIAIDQLSKHVADHTGEEEVEQEKEENNEADQQNEENRDNGGRQKPNPPKRPPPDVGTLIPDGGEEGQKTKTVHDSARNTNITIPDKKIDKISNQKNDWDHNQIGNNEQEVEDNLETIIQDPDEIWKDSGQDRWMYVKDMSLNGRDIVVTLFVFNGKVATAFAPTHQNGKGADGYSRKHAKWYIKNQNMVKKHEPGDVIVSSVNKGDKSKNSGTEPNPTT